MTLNVTLVWSGEWSGVRVRRSPHLQPYSSNTRYDVTLASYQSNAPCKVVSPDPLYTPV